MRAATRPTASKAHMQMTREVQKAAASLGLALQLARPQGELWTAKGVDAP
jgi:hypothetical protein